MFLRFLLAGIITLGPYFLSYLIYQCYKLKRLYPSMRLCELIKESVEYIYSFPTLIGVILIGLNAMVLVLLIGKFILEFVFKFEF